MRVRKNKLFRKGIVSALALSFILGMNVQAAPTQYVGKPRMYTQKDCAVLYARSIAATGYGPYYDDLPNDIKIESNWCAAFTKVLYGIESDNEYGNSMYNSCTYTMNQGTFHGKNEKPEPGWLVLYEENGKDDGPEHIGIVYTVKNEKTPQGVYKIQTVEGNWFDINDTQGQEYSNRDPYECEQYERIKNLAHCDFTIPDYARVANITPYWTRRIGVNHYDDVRYGMICGYVEPKVEKKYYEVGDVNGDDKFNVIDYMLVMKAALNMDIAGFTTDRTDKMGPVELYWRCDINGDGHVTAVDATIMIKALLDFDTNPRWKDRYNFIKY